jgi:hypothetical protein
MDFSDNLTGRGGQAPSPFAQVFRQLLANGYSPLPISPDSKAPSEFRNGKWWGMKDWQHFREQPAASFILTHWAQWPDANVGILTGTKAGPGRFVVATDFDLTDFDLLDDIERSIKPSPVQKRGRRGYSSFYQADDGTPGFNADGVELLTDRRQTVIPPSIHPDLGRPYVWRGEQTLLNTRAEDLPYLSPDDIARFREAVEVTLKKPIREPREPRQDMPPPEDMNPWQRMNWVASNNLDAWVSDLHLYKLMRVGSGYKAVAHWRPSTTGRPFGTGESYTAIYLVKAALGMEQEEAFQWLGGRLGLLEEGIDIQPKAKSRTAYTDDGQAFDPETGEILEERPAPATGEGAGGEDAGQGGDGDPAGAAGAGGGGGSGGGGPHSQDGHKKPQPPPPRTFRDMLKFIPFSTVLRAPRFTVPGFIGDGLTIIAGQQGIGKTTAVLPLACIVAGIHPLVEPLAPRNWRHIIYVSEDTEQVQRILNAVAGGDTTRIAQIKERIHIVDAKRLPAEEFVKAGDEYRKRFAREADGVTLPPLVVLDTKSAVFKLDDENDNAEASTMMAHLKQDFSGLPTWIIGHIAKANMTRADAALMSIRGASSIEGDANQVIFLVAENGERYLVRGKTRFEAAWKEILIMSHVTKELALDEYGGWVPVLLRHASFEPLSNTEREEKREAKKAEEDAQKEQDRIEAVLAFVRAARERGEMVSKDRVARQARGNNQALKLTIDGMVDDGLLAEVTIPEPHRDNPKRKTFLIDLDEEERSEYRLTKEPPRWKLEQVAPWLKTAAQEDATATSEDVKNGEGDTSEGVSPA